jgi:hypothetical protein
MDTRSAASRTRSETLTATAHLRLPAGRQLR